MDNTTKKSDFEITLIYHFKCGMLFSKDVAFATLQNMDSSVPIRAESNALRGGTTIGRTTSKPYDMVWEEDTRTWRFKVDGVLFSGGIGIKADTIHYDGIRKYLDEGVATSVVIDADGIGGGDIMDFE